MSDSKVTITYSLDKEKNMVMEAQAEGSAADLSTIMSVAVANGKLDMETAMGIAGNSKRRSSQNLN